MDETKPSAANTGLVSPTTSVVTGTASFNVNDQVIQNTRFDGNVNISGKRITFINCHFRGAPTGSGLAEPLERGVVNCTSVNCEDIVFERCLFRPQHPEVQWNGCVFGHDYTLIRCDMSGTDDCFGCNNSGGGPANVEVAGCYLHDLSYFCPHPSTPDNRSHSDNGQMHQSSGHREVYIHGCTILGFIDPTISDYEAPVYDPGEPGTTLSGYPFFNEEDFYGNAALWSNSCITYSPKGSPAGPIVVDKNWIDGSAVKISVPTFGTGDTISGFEVTNNRFGQNSRGAGFHHEPNPTPPGHIAKRNSCPMTITGNIVVDENDNFVANYNTFTSLGA